MPNLGPILPKTPPINTSRRITPKYLNFVGGPFGVNAGLIVRVHVSVVGIGQNVSLLKFRRYWLCILLREHIHDPCGTHQEIWIITSLYVNIHSSNHLFSKKNEYISLYVMHYICFFLVLSVLFAAVPDWFLYLFLIREAMSLIDVSLLESFLRTWETSSLLVSLPSRCGSWYIYLFDRCEVVSTKGSIYWLQYFCCNWLNM